MTNQETTDFYARLTHGPAILFLGQDYLLLESSRDPFLGEVLRKYGGGAEGEEAHYGHILEGSASESVETSLAWMQERCERLSVPEHIELIAQFAWSAVYTSAIDVIWQRAFRSPWRQLQPIYEDKYKPIDPRNRSKLHCTYLFGAVNRSVEVERPPLTKPEFRRRRQEAIVLARRLPELLTPLGVLVVEGYAGAADWFSPDELLPIIDELGTTQTHVFSVSEDLQQIDDIADYARSGKIVLHPESLAECLVRGAESGFVKLGVVATEEEGARSVTVGHRVLRVDRDLWNQVARSAMILDDTILFPPRDLSPDRLYSEFRNFLSDSGVTPQWEGYKQGFAFRRDFEERLRKTVLKRLASGELRDDAIIVHGQTGTGKTVAVGALAYKVRKRAQYPVLFIERRTSRPLASDIDAFCNWAEDAGAEASLIVWDGMPEDVNEYFEFLHSLTARGRKVVLVGTHYRIDSLHLSRENFIEAPARLSPSEVSRFREFLSHIDPSLKGFLDAHLRDPDDSFLVALYRLLPDTRAGIRTGVLREVDSAEQKIRQIAREHISQAVSASTLAVALAEAGLITAEQLLSSESKDIGGEPVDEVQELVGLVMVPGRFGLNTPVELLLRTLHKEDVLNLVNIFNKVDIFRWHEDPVGNIAVGPRNSLEARLILASRLGGPTTELSFAEHLLLEVRSAERRPDAPEVEFAVDLVRSMGPEGQDSGYFAPYFRDLSLILRRLRTERSPLSNIVTALLVAPRLAVPTRLERSVSPCFGMQITFCLDPTIRFSLISG